jgi:phenylalanyl-tRNA synthetase beta chain
LAKVVKVFDIYRGGSIAEGMTSVAVRVIFYDEGRSLQESETEAVSARIVEAWKKELGAELRS